MSLRRTHLVGAALVAALGILALPALAAADSGNAATHEVQTFTEESDWFGPDPCSGLTITGVGTQTVTQDVTFTSNGGAHVRLDIDGLVPLYQANGPGPSDPQPGAFVGMWAYHGSVSDQAPPDAQGSTTGVTAGTLTFPDGTSARRQVMFHITWQKEGPPKLFFAKFICAGA